MDSPLPSPRLARKASSPLPAALSPVLRTLGLEEEDPEDVFEIHAKEGAGAFGRVFRASYRRDPARLAALKVIPVALEAGQRGEDIENVRREIQFLRECDHPNVVAFFGAYYKDQALWVAMEYCGGGSVGDVSRRRRLSEVEIAVIARGALCGLAYLHARKKIHRDIKGGNILLTSAGEVKIADFGVSAQLKDTLSRRGTFVGTPYWMSPEMIQDSDYDYKSDIWSLGITIIELADQRPPLFDEHPMRVLIQIPRNPPPSVKTPHAWTPLLLQFLQFCLRKDPKERPSAVECLEHAFIQHVRDVPFVFADGVGGISITSDGHAGKTGPVEGSAMVPSGTPTRTRGSLTNSGESEAMADDVTLKAPPARPGKGSVVNTRGALPTPMVPETDLRVASLRRRSLEREGQRLEAVSPQNDDEGGSTASDADTGLVSTPRESESVVEEAWDLSRSADAASSRSSRSDDEDDDANDAGVEGFAFRHGPVSSSSSSSSLVPPAKPPLEIVSGDELLRQSVDEDPFEMPAVALINQIHAAASTLVGQSTRLRTAATASTTPLPLPLPSAPSPVARVPKTTSTDEHKLPSTPPSNQSANDPPVQIPPPRRELNSFSRTESIRRVANHAMDHHHEGGEPGWNNPLAQLAMPSHDRVNSLLSSLSASSARLFPPQASPSHVVDPSFEPTSRESSLRVASSRERMGFASPTASADHFIGAPFRVSHELNVRFNTLDAKFEGVPTGAGWASVHRQFGLALTQLHGRSGSSDRVPALVHMLRRELLQRDGLECKYIYRVSPDQSEVQRAKRAIDSGAFAPASVTDPHVFASLLKHWLRELPTPLLAAISRTELTELVETLAKPDDSSSKPPHIAGSGTDASRDVVFAVAFTDVHAAVTTRLLAKLPAPERDVLLWLVDHMLEVIAKSARNAMTAHSLAVVLAPNVYRWASSTPADASVISRQVATLLRVLLAWRQRCRGGSGGTTESVASPGGDSRRVSVRSRPTPSKADTISPSVTEARDRGLLTMSTSLQESLNGLRSSLTMASTSRAPRESTVSGMLLRSSGSVTHFVSASSGVSQYPGARGGDALNRAAEPQEARSRSLEMLLLHLVDGLWSELPLSIMLDEPPPIVRSLHAKFQRNVLMLVKAHGRRDQERRWASGLLQRVNDPSKAPHLEMDPKLPLSLRPFTRWLMAALKLEAFTTLLKQERHVRDRLQKQWPSHAMEVGAMSADGIGERSFGMGHILELALSERGSNNPHYKIEMEPSTDIGIKDAMQDGAATMVRILHDSRDQQSSASSTAILPLAEELVTLGEEEPMVGNVLVVLSAKYAKRYHLEEPHRQVLKMAECALLARP